MPEKESFVMDAQTGEKFLEEILKNISDTQI